MSQHKRLCCSLRCCSSRDASRGLLGVQHAVRSSMRWAAIHGQLGRTLHGRRSLRCGADTIGVSRFVYGVPPTAVENIVSQHKCTSVRICECLPLSACTYMVFSWLSTSCLITELSRTFYLCMPYVYISVFMAAQRLHVALHCSNSRDFVLLNRDALNSLHVSM